MLDRILPMPAAIRSLARSVACEYFSECAQPFHACLLPLFERVALHSYLSMPTRNIRWIVFTTVKGKLAETSADPQ